MVEQRLTRIANILETPSPTDVYHERGAWARHYSTVRMTVCPFLITTSIGVFAFGHSQSLSELYWVSIFVWIAMLALFFVFTNLLREELAKCLEKADKLTEADKVREQRDTATWIVVGLTAAFFIVVIRAMVPELRFVNSLVLLLGTGQLSHWWWLSWDLDPK